MITETSLSTFKENKEKFELKRIQILKALKEIQPANNMMLHKKTRITLSCVCGRMDDLRNKFKWVTFSHKDKCPHTDSKTQFFKLTKIGERVANSYIII